MEQNRQHHTLFLETAAAWSAARIRENKLPLSAALLSGLLCYMYALTNKLINHDEAYSLFTKGATVTSGRWGLGALDSIFPNYSMPWINGALALIFMAIAAALFVRILSIRSPVMQGLLSGAIVAFPSLIGTFAYMFTTHAFGLSFLLAVMAVWFVQRKQRHFLLAGLVCMVLSLSIYQSYISVTAGLLVLILIRQLLEGQSLSAVLSRGFGYVFFLALSLVVYYAATQAVLILKDVSLNAYAGGNADFSLADIPGALVLAYQDFFRFFLDGCKGLMPTGFSRLMHSVCIGSGIFLAALHAAGKFPRDLGRLALLAGLIAILPLTVNCMYLITGPQSVHTLVLYGFVSLYGLCAVTADVSLSADGAGHLLVWCRRVGLEMFSLLLAGIIVSHVFLANQVWLNLQLRYENAYAFFTALTAEIQMLPEYDESCTLALIGTYPEPEFYETEFSFTAEMAGLKGFLPDSYSNGRFLEYYLGFPLPLATAEEIQALAASDAVSQMPVYPSHGAIAVVDHFIVVKFS